MLEVVFRGKFLTLKEIWFSEKIGRTSKCDYCKYCGIGDSPYSKSEKQHSLLTDLFRSEDELYELISRQCRRDIERAAREKIQITAYNSAKISEHPEILRELLGMYDLMITSKNLISRLTMETLNGYVTSGAFSITSASYEGKTIVYHAYIFDREGKTKARCLYNCSDFRSEESPMANLIGRANKYLLWCDVRLFKGMGIHYMDWGGITSFDEPNGVDRFKMNFGGDAVTYYNILLPVSLKAKVHTIMRRKDWRFVKGTV